MPSSTVVNHRGNLMMVDCGEGAQRQFMLQHLRFSRLNHIFLTHLHGDHVLGLPGLLSTMALGQEGGRVMVHTFEDGAEILTHILDFFARERSFELEFDVIRPEERVILETKSLTVRTIPLRHRIPTVGYVFEEKPKLRHIRPDMIERHGIPFCWINRIKAGDDYVSPSGLVIPNTDLTTPPSPTLSYAHISDTVYMPGLADKIRGVNLLFHETTYLDEQAQKAKDRFHSTARQAAMVARDAGARALLTGHYSSRHKDETAFVTEASEVFAGPVYANREGLVTPVG